MSEERTAEIVAEARDLLEAEGEEALTMRRLAARLGIKAPSLYKQVAGKPELEVRLIAGGFEEFGAVLAEHEGELAPMALAYREWALAHPHLYELMTAGPLPRDQLPPGVEAAAARPIVELFGDADAARAAWAAAHGLTVLELSGRFPEDADLDAAWAKMIEAFEP